MVITGKCPKCEGLMGLGNDGDDECILCGYVFYNNVEVVDMTKWKGVEKDFIDCFRKGMMNRQVADKYDMPMATLNNLKKRWKVSEILQSGMEKVAKPEGEPKRSIADLGQHMVEPVATHVPVEKPEPSHAAAHAEPKYAKIFAIGWKHECPGLSELQVNVITVGKGEHKEWWTDYGSHAVPVKYCPGCGLLLPEVPNA